MILFRTDSNEEIATGHVMRCMTVARQLILKNETVTFITSDHNSDVFLEGKNWGHTVLDTDWRDMESELKKYNEMFDKCDKKNVIIVDSYMATPEYLKGLKKWFKVIYFDDEYKNIYDIHMVINYNIFYSVYNYERDYEKLNTKLLLGVDYIPLREEFRNVIKSTPKSDKRNIMIIVGGGDKHHIVLFFLKNCKEVYNSLYHFHIIVGGFNPDYEAIVKLAEKYDNVTIYHQVSAISDIMLKMDVVLSAAGIFLYEAAACGLPSVYFCVADNQSKVRYGFEKYGLHYYAGDIKEGIDVVLDRCFAKLRELFLAPRQLENMSKKLLSTFDGHGATRIAEEIITLAEE